MGSDIEGLSTVPGPWERMVQLFPYHSPEPILWPPTTEQLYDEDLYRLPRRFVVGDTTLAASDQAFEWSALNVLTLLITNRYQRPKA